MNAWPPSFDVAAFGAHLRALTPRTWVTPSLIALHTLVWLLSIASGVSPWLPTAADLLAWGGNHGPLTLHQPWRLLTACLMHAGIVHLALNMWALWETGRLAERFYGNGAMLIIYLTAGVSGAVASLFFAARTGLSVGASGAIFGLVGCLLAALFSGDRQIPPSLLHSLRSSMLSFVGYSLVMGLLAGFIDNAAHLGGLTAGAALGWLLMKKFDPSYTPSRALAHLLPALALMGVILLGCWWWLHLPM